LTAHGLTLLSTQMTQTAQTTANQATFVKIPT
jgi:hypothetical protein